MNKINFKAFYFWGAMAVAAGCVALDNIPGAVAFVILASIAALLA